MRTLVFVLLCLTCTFSQQLQWSTCPTYTDNSKWQPDPKPPTSALCSTISVPYLYHTSSFNISLSTKKYSAGSSTKNTILLFGDSIVGNSGSALEWIAVRLFNLMNRTHDVVIPEFRGSSINNCSTQYTYDMVSQWQCQNKLSSAYGTDFSGFSVDHIARDMLAIASVIKMQFNHTITLFGRGFGSYILHRALQIDSTLIDSVIMDGVCAYPYCNVSDWDTQRNQMAQKIIAQLPVLNTTIAHKYYSSYNFEVLSVYKNILSRLEKGLDNCGRSISRFDFKRRSTYMIFDPTLRPLFLSALFHLTRCDYYDVAIGILVYGRGTYITGYFNDIHVPHEVSFLTSHIMVSELKNRSVSDNSYLFSNDINSYVESLVKQGWKGYTAPTQEIAKYNKPMLLLHGDYDPTATVDKVKLFAANFSAATLAIMPGMSSNSFMKSYMKDQRQTTCGMMLVSQFLMCPTCVQDTSCTSRMEGLTLDGDELTRSLFGDPYALRKNLPLGPIEISAIIMYAIPLAIPILIWIMLFVYRQNKRVTSRVHGPYFGLAYVFIHCIVILVTSNAWTSAPGLYFGQMMYDVCIVIASTVVAMQTIRFFLLTAVYSRMAADSSVNKVLRILASKSLSVTVFVAVGFVFAVVGLIMFALVASVDGDAVIWMGNLTIAYVAVVMIIAVLFFMYDIVSHAIRSQCNFVHYFANDPLLFRLDSLFIIPILVIGVTANMLFLFFNASNPPAVIVGNALNVLSMLLMCMFLGGNVVIACVIDTIRGRSTTTVDIDKSDYATTFMRSEIGVEALKRYAEKEFSLENIIAWLSIENALKDSDLDTKLIEIQQKYMTRSSMMEINVPSHTSERFTNLMNSNNASDDEKRRVLVEVQGAVMTNIKDTMNRFRYTQEFNECLRSLTSKKEIMNAMDLQ